MMMPTARILSSSSSLSAGALNHSSVPCTINGASYSNCRPNAVVSGPPIPAASVSPPPPDPPPPSPPPPTPVNPSPPPPPPSVYSSPPPERQPPLPPPSLSPPPPASTPPPGASYGASPATPPPSQQASASSPPPPPVVVWSPPPPATLPPPRPPPPPTPTNLTQPSAQVDAPPQTTPPRQSAAPGAGVQYPGLVPFPSPPDDTTGAAGSSSAAISSGAVVGISLAGGAIVAFLIFVFLFVLWRKNKHRQVPANDPQPQPQAATETLVIEQKRSLLNKDNISHTDHMLNLPISDMTRKEGSYEPKLIMAGFSQLYFTYEELATATDGFSDTNLLGEGGFGFVYKGVLSDGKEVAVKQLRSDSKQGVREFQAEIDIISRVHHKHLVSLVGYCNAREKLLLVYDFVPNKTLEFHLHGKGQPTMDWSTRMKIALGSAKGLAYLHEDCHPKIIHRDIKASNILLDTDYGAQVADFGLAKLFSDSITHVTTRIMGTIGYLAPEYAASGKLTEKSDVYSFGVLLLELITGSRPTGKTSDLADDSLVEWVNLAPSKKARPLLSRALDEGNYDIIADPHLQKSYDSREMAHMVACAAASIRHSAKHRPLMSQIVHVLEGEILLDTLNQGIKPGHSVQMYNLSESSSQSSDQYIMEVKNATKLPDTSSSSSSSAQHVFSFESNRRLSND